MTQPDTNQTEVSRRRGVRRTAWAVGLVAVGVYVAFMLAAMIP